VLIDEFGQYEAMITAEYLCHLGRRVRYVTRQPSLGAQVDELSRQDYVTRLLEHDFEVELGTAVTRIDGKTVRGTTGLRDREWSEEADSVVLLMGKLPNDSLYHELVAAGADVRRVGDSVAPRQITDAIYEGNQAGRAI
jgi:NADPH-dependent 2,4-dienoyl-CoA reductase/sulfur reductase-like enzyme